MDSSRRADGLRDGPSDGAEGLALACVIARRKKVQVAPPAAVEHPDEGKEEWRCERARGGKWVIGRVRGRSGARTLISNDADGDQP